MKTSHCLPDGKELVDMIKKSSKMSDTEEPKPLTNDLEILQACKNGVKYSNGRIYEEETDENGKKGYRIKYTCDPRAIRSLKDCGHMRCGVSQDLFDTIKTTDDGLIQIKYLKSLGIKDRNKPRFGQIFSKRSENPDKRPKKAASE